MKSKVNVVLHTWGPFRRRHRRRCANGVREPAAGRGRRKLSKIKPPRPEPADKNVSSGQLYAARPVPRAREVTGGAHQADSPRRKHYRCKATLRIIPLYYNLGSYEERVA